VHLAYQKRYRINKDQLAIDRHRQLFSQVLGYPLPTTPPDFGLADHPWPTPLIDIPKAPFLVFVSQASWTNKCWPVAYWRQLIELAGQQGYRVLLPWGTVDEQQRARQLAASFSHIQILPHLSLSEIAAIMLASAGVVANDTGLAHVAASLDIPVVTLYGPTNPLLIGATGRYSKHLVATGFDCIPCHKRICQTTDYKGPEGQCLKTLAVHKVWQALIEMKSDYLPVLNKES
jgi:heptosyltransferase-1